MAWLKAHLLQFGSAPRIFHFDGVRRLDGGAGIDFAIIARSNFADVGVGPLPTSELSVAATQDNTVVLADGTRVRDSERLTFYASSGHGSLTGGSLDDTLSAVPATTCWTAEPAQICWTAEPATTK